MKWCNVEMNPSFIEWITYYVFTTKLKIHLYILLCIGYLPVVPLNIYTKLIYASDEKNEAFLARSLNFRVVVIFI